MAIDAYYEAGEAATAAFPAQSGVVLVCGNAWTLYNDLERAREIYPLAPVLAVNGAARHVKAKFLFTLHPRKMERWIIDQEHFHRFGDFTTHSSGSLGRLTKLGKPRSAWSGKIQYWWPEARTPGSSGWGGRRLAKLMGFDTVVLCGVPLSIGGYADRDIARDWQRESNVRAYRHAVEKDIRYHEGVYSMSGFTRELFGEPNGDDGHGWQDQEKTEVSAQTVACDFQGD